MAYRNPMGQDAARPRTADGRWRSKAVAERFGRNLFMARRRAGFSQEVLAQRCSLHRTHICFLEAGQRIPRVDTLLKLAGALDVDASYLLSGVGK